jgi:hypothetical protein
MYQMSINMIELHIFIQYWESVGWMNWHQLVFHSIFWYIVEFVQYSVREQFDVSFAVIIEMTSIAIAVLIVLRTVNNSY